MKKLISLPPADIAYIESLSKTWFGGEKKFSQTLSRILNEHATLSNIKDMKDKLLEMENR